MVPKSFRIAGHKVKVSIVPEKNWSDDETVGFFNSQNMTISLLDGIGPQRTQQIFCHEVVHAILHTMAEEKLCSNEKFVDLFGSLLHQVWTTVEGKAPATQATRNARRKS